VLRTPHTVTALHELAKNQHLELDDANQLIDSYQFLRRIENAIQMLENQQTHLIPSSDANKQSMLSLLGVESWDELVAEVNHVRRFVNAPSQAESIIDLWEEGYQAYGVSNDVRHRILPLTSALANYVTNDKGDTSIVKAIASYY